MMSRRAFTLTELLVTISIMAFLLLAGVGVYWRMNRGFALRAAVSTIESTLRGARAFAVHERSPAQVVLVTRPLTDPPDDYTHEVDKLYAFGKRTVSGWHFEPSQIDGSTLKGALDQTGALTNFPVNPFVSGKVGRCILFDGSMDISVSSPYLDEIRDGVFVEAYVKPDADGLSSGALLPIVSKGDGGQPTFSLALRYQRIGNQELFWLEGSVNTESGVAKAHTDPLIRAGEWTHVALEYNRDGQRDVLSTPGIVLRINGREVDLREDAPGSDPLAPNTLPMLIGDGFQGCIDEVKIAALVATEVRKLPKNTEVYVDRGTKDPNDLRIHFDSEGKLDTRFHNRIVRFRVSLFRDQISKKVDLTRTVQVNWMGEVEVGETERAVDE